MYPFKTILCPVDFSEHSQLALRYALQFAKAYDARLIVYHVVPQCALVGAFRSANVSGNSAKSFEEIRDDLDDFLARSVAIDRIVWKKFGAGDSTPQCITRTAQEEDADLVVMGTHGRTGYVNMKTGSVCREVLNTAPMPVLAVHSGVNHYALPHIRNILCAVDVHETTPRMIELALSISHRLNSDLWFFYAGLPEQQNEWIDMQRYYLDKMRKLIAPENGHRTVHYLAEEGDPAELITDAAVVRDIDLIIMGHHTRKSPDYWFLGSVAARVIANAPCPVFIQRG